MPDVGDLVRGGPPNHYPAVVVGRSRNYFYCVWRLDTCAPAMITCGGVTKLSESDLTEQEWAAYCAWRLTNV